MNRVDIGIMRRRLFLSVDDPWNGVVRDVTAKLESEGSVDEVEVLKALADYLRNKALGDSLTIFHAANKCVSCGAEQASEVSQLRDEADQAFIDALVYRVHKETIEVKP